ncbi:MAG: NADH-quinone oxidoreductase subunit C [bacterium]|nr:NADH-quinone oxidoreductase subunit C [bacterium]
MDELRNALGDLAEGWEERHGRRLYCAVSRERLVEAALRLLGRGLRFATASATDMRSAMEILYHFSIDREGAVLSLRVTLPKEDLVADSLAPHLAAAEWIEREMAEMLGITFRGLTDTRRLLLADDWPAGSHPLRRDGEVPG